MGRLRLLHKCYITREQKARIIREQVEYRQRQKKYKKKNYTPAVVISTRTIEEPTFKEQYHNFLNSPFWQKRREQVLKRHNSRCVICYSTDSLNAHHICYDNVFTSKPDKRGDVVILCRKHHEEFHEKYPLQKNMRRQWKEFFHQKRRERHEHL